jgi:hypothetical protein
VAGFVWISVSNLVAYRAGEMAERYDLRGFDAIHLASAARLGEEFSGVRFLACDARLMEAARGTQVRAGVRGRMSISGWAVGVPAGTSRWGAARGLRVRPRPAVKAGRSFIIRANRARK